MPKIHKTTYNLSIDITGDGRTLTYSKDASILRTFSTLYKQFINTESAEGGDAVEPLSYFSLTPDDDLAQAFITFYQDTDKGSTIGISLSRFFKLHLEEFKQTIYIARYLIGVHPDYKGKTSITTYDPFIIGLKFSLHHPCNKLYFVTRDSSYRSFRVMRYVAEGFPLPNQFYRENNLRFYQAIRDHIYPAYSTHNFHPKIPSDIPVDGSATEPRNSLVRLFNTIINSKPLSHPADDKKMGVLSIIPFGIFDTLNILLNVLIYDILRTCKRNCLRQRNAQLSGHSITLVKLATQVSILSSQTDSIMTSVFSASVFSFLALLLTAHLGWLADKKTSFNCFFPQKKININKLIHGNEVIRPKVINVAARYS